MLVEASLPRGVACGLENFAGDPDVQNFVHAITRGIPDLDLEVWVHWAGPPDVKILRKSGQSLLLRSERFDVLLIEYFHLIRIASVLGKNPECDRIIASTVAKWFTEFLFGLREPRLALRSSSRHHQAHHSLVHHTFRDEALASVNRAEKAALQCCSLSHEIAHVIYPRHKGKTLDFVIDGVDLRTHLIWEPKQMGCEERVIDAMAAAMDHLLKADQLVTEIEADIEALGTIADFLTQCFGVSREQAFRSSLFALQAQSFLNFCKRSCRLIVKHFRDGINEKKFNELIWVEGQYISARARVALRRAGLLWYQWDKRDGITAEPDEYRKAVDAALIELQPLLLSLANAAFNETEQLYKESTALCPIQASETALDVDLDNYMSDVESRVAISNILIAMGYPGSILHDIEGQIRGIDRLGA